MQTIRAQTNAPSRASAEVGEHIRSAIEKGRFPAGQLLPGLRALSGQYGVAQKTLQRAMAVLAAEGLIAAEPRRGYRVLGGPAEREKTRPLAYVAALEGGPLKWNDIHQQLLAGFQGAARRRGYALLGVGSAGRDQDEVMRQVAGARAWGLLLDTASPELIGMVRAANVPAVMVDSWTEDAGIDTVIQDGFQGGLLAAAHLVALGHRRIAWFGSTLESAHSMARYSGANMGLMRAGLAFEPGLRIEARPEHVTGPAIDKARALLSCPDRPRAVIALWQDTAAALVVAARELGLVLGRDLDMVGWCVDESYDDYCRANFAGGPVPPMVTWSVGAMAELAVSRLAERRSHPALAPVMINVPVRLRLAGESR